MIQPGGGLAHHLAQTQRPVPLGEVLAVGEGVLVDHEHRGLLQGALAQQAPRGCLGIAAALHGQVAASREDVQGVRVHESAVVVADVDDHAVLPEVLRIQVLMSWSREPSPCRACARSPAARRSRCPRRRGWPPPSRGRRAAAPARRRWASPPPPGRRTPRVVGHPQHHPVSHLALQERSRLVPARRRGAVHRQDLVPHRDPAATWAGPSCTHLGDLQLRPSSRRPRSKRSAQKARRAGPAARPCEWPRWEPFSSPTMRFMSRRLLGPGAGAPDLRARSARRTACQSAPW